MIAVPIHRPFFGWRVVAAAFVLAVFGWGVGFYGPPVYLYAVVERTGWPVSLVSAAVTVHFLCGALVVANLARLYQTLGVLRVTCLGVALLALGVVGWATADAPWQLFAAALTSGAGWVAISQRQQTPSGPPLESRCMSSSHAWRPNKSFVGSRPDAEVWPKIFTIDDWRNCLGERN